MGTTVALWARLAFVTFAANLGAAMDLSAAPAEGRSLGEALQFDVHGLPPFSFLLDGAPSAEFQRAWTCEVSESHTGEGWTKTRYTYTNPDGSLIAVLTRTVYADFPVIEWVVSLENTGTSDSPLITDLLAADLPLGSPADGPYILHYADGSQAQPTDFHPREASFTPENELTFVPSGGRSSDGVMPYFNVCGNSGGVMAAIGWTGQWKASFQCDAEGRVVFRAGMEHVHLRLHPGERIRTPAIILMRYSGERIDGHNAWRKFMLRHCTPHPGGKPPVLPVAASGATIGFNEVSETNQTQAIGNIASHGLPVDTYWIDAGWTTGGFPLGMGTWDPDPARFPQGLRPVADAAHKAGLRFLAWFEPERVMPGTTLYTTRAAWLLAPSNLPNGLAYQKDWRLLDLGNPEARAWAANTIASMIGDYGVDIYRQDFNMHPLYYWRTDEPADREGMREIRYVEGLYAYLDALLEKHPQLLIDNCASGGRRLDFEMMRRSVPLWRTDYCWEPVGAQCIEYALSFWLPLHGLGAVSTSPYDFRSGMGANVSCAFDYYTADAPFWPELKERLNEYRALRPLYWGDFYPLTPYAPGEDAWLAWQFDRPDLGEGMIQAFRRSACEADSLRVDLHGLDESARYAVTNQDGGEVSEYTGAQLMTEGVQVTLPSRPAAGLFTYKKLGQSAGTGR
ncbi:MAG: alpha-galactosidase [Candidatus Hydrogenedentes bacterium]|nr:alpha-galactosidase [Candidatus Hydrogenedentota bacterium]